MAHFRRLPPGVRTVVAPHGGHLWSLQWRPHRALSVEPLRIDHQVSRLFRLSLVISELSTYIQPPGLMEMRLMHRQEHE